MAYRIALMIPNLGGGGAERVCLDLAHEFNAKGYMVDIVLLSAEGGLLEEARASFNVVDLAGVRFRDAPALIAKYINTSKPNAVIVSMWPLTAMAVIGKFIAKHNPKLLLVEHTQVSMHYKGKGFLHKFLLTASIKFLYRFSDAVAAVSLGAAKDLSKLMSCNLNKVHVLHNPVSKRPFPTSQMVEQAERDWGGLASRRLLTVGSLKKEKNHFLLLEAISKTETDNLRLMIVGSGKLEKELKIKAKELCIEDKVIFKGFVKDPSAYYYTADIFLLSSDYEGFGNVIVEALSFGLPVISTDCPSGPSEILENGLHGHLVAVGDAESYAAKIDYVINNCQASKSVHARVSDFSVDIVASKYLDILHSL
jgi:glycosyltransferase involved in cell wall biosynthesis